MNEPGVDGKPPLMLASEPEKEYEGVVRWLLEHGADVNARDEDWRTPLMFAAQYRRKACIHVLLAHGVDIAAKDTEGDNALQYMPRFFYFANPDIVQLLTPSKEH